MGPIASTARGQCNPQELAKLIASDAAAFDYFGTSVAVSGDTAVVGAYLDDHAGGNTDEGSAFVFVRSGGVWAEQAKLIASDAAANDRFGWSVAVSGDTAVVGAFQNTHAGGLAAGSAYVFVRAGGVWTQQAKLTASDAAAFDNFGYSVAVSGDTAVVGAWTDNNLGGEDAGSAYVFVRVGGVWTEQAKLIALDAEMFENFGNSVAVSGDTTVVGERNDNRPGGVQAGSAYVFVRFGTSWTQQQKLIASDAAVSDEFGYSVTVSGDTAVVGALEDDHAGGTDAGSAYVFVRTGGVWTEQAKLIALDAAESDRFGISVALSGDTAVVGSWFGDAPGAANSGSAYVFVRAGGVWTQQPKLIASDEVQSDQFGYSVAVSGDTAVVGANLDDHAGGDDAGSAYVFDLGCAAACCAGDFDGDSAVTNADIPGFVGALLAGGACPAPPACCPGDFNADGLVDGGDMPGFLAKLIAGGACP